MPAKKKKAQIATYTHPADTRRNIRPRKWSR